MEIQFSQLLDMSNPFAVFEEVKYNFIRNYDIREFFDVRNAFTVFNDMYDGKYPGYLKCNTKYHDKIHTTDALLSISRLINGYNIKNKNKVLPVKIVKIALIATIFHDTGYIQTTRDQKGTGAKYTLNHVERSIDFIKKYFKKIGYSHSDYLAAKNMVNCTGLFCDIDSIKFQRPDEKLLGFMLGSSDMLGQMASRTYLERLIYLYKEFREGHVKGFDSEYDLLKKTHGFYEKIKVWLDSNLKGVSKYSRYHFEQVYKIKDNLDQTAINKHIDYLKIIIKTEEAYKTFLRRKCGINNGHHSSHCQ